MYSIGRGSELVDLFFVDGWMVPVVRYLTEGIYWLVMLDPEEAEKCRKSAIFGGPKIGSVDARALHFLPASPGRRCGNVEKREGL